MIQRNMSNQPLDDKKLKTGETYLLNRMMAKDPIVLGMEIQGRYGMFSLSGLKSGKLMVSTSDKFLMSTDNVKDAITEISRFENTELSYYKDRKIETTYVAEDEVVETKIYEEIMPKKPTKANSVIIGDKTFYIVKKSPNGKSSGKIFCLYTWHTRNLIWAHEDKDILIGFLYSRYKEIEHKDI